MWNYSRNLQYPINIKNRNPEMAKVIISQYGGPDCNSYYHKAKACHSTCSFVFSTIFTLKLQHWQTHPSKNEYLHSTIFRILNVKG